MIEPIVDIRPWGKFVTFCENKRATVKIIRIRAGESLSYKKYDSEDGMWVALDQGLVALIGDKTIFMKDIEIAEEPVWLPKDTLRSIKNVNVGIDARFMEISFGDSAGVDSVDHQDSYGRV